MNRKPAYNRGKGKSYAWIMDHVGYAEDACLIWPFSRQGGRGYGYFGFEGRFYRAHRFMCTKAHGEPPTPKHQAAHSCGNGHMGCVNPLHLSWKTNSENQRDRKKHGTDIGQIGSRTRLKVEQITEIRSSKGIVRVDDLAKRFGVKRGCIEYWQRHTRPPAPPGSSPATIYRRQKRHIAVP